MGGGLSGPKGRLGEEVKSDLAYCMLRQADSLKSTTHLFIIGGQHTVECYKNLVEAGKVDEADKAKASSFNIIPVFAPKADHLKLLLLSRVLTQDMAGP